jgi:ElaA protein
MNEAMSFCGEHYAERRILLSAQLYLARFYESFGFTAASAPYDDFGIAHVEMTRVANDRQISPEAR